jgi:hypothetical protein
MDFRITALHEVEGDLTRVNVILVAHLYIGDDPYRMSVTMPVSHELKISQVLSFSVPHYQIPFRLSDSYVNTSGVKPSKSPEEQDLADEIKRLEAQAVATTLGVDYLYDFSESQINKTVDAFVETVTPKKKKRRK